MDFLRHALRNGSVDNKLVRKDAREADISEITLKRAKAALGIRSQKQGDGSWAWALPEGDRKSHTSQNDPHEALDPLPIDRPDPGQQGEKNGGDDHLERSGDFRINKPNSQNESEQDAKGDQGDHGSKSRARRLSAKEVQRIRKLVREGMSPEWARKEVLGEP